MNTKSRNGAQYDAEFYAHVMQILCKFPSLVTMVIVTHVNSYQ